MKNKITIEMYREGDDWFVESKILHIFAHGKKPEKALEDFSKHLQHFIKWYKDPDDRFHKSALEIKRTYTKFFGKNK